MTLSRGLFESVLRELLVERAEHTVQLFEGSGTQWRKARCVPSSGSDQPRRLTPLSSTKALEAQRNMRFTPGCLKDDQRATEVAAQV